MLNVHTREVAHEVIKKAFYTLDACKEHTCRLIWLAQDSGLYDFETTLMIRLYKEKFCDFEGGAFARPLKKAEIFAQPFELYKREEAIGSKSWYAFQKNKNVSLEDLGWAYVITEGMFPNKSTAYLDEDSHVCYEAYFDPTDLDPSYICEAIFYNFSEIEIEFLNP